MTYSAEEGSNPLVPPIWLMGAYGLAVLALALVIAAAIGIARARHLSGTARAVWILIVLAFPLAGPVLWFVVGRRAGAPGLSGRSSPPFGDDSR